MFAMRWVAAGLMPIRPVVALVTDVELPEGCSLKLTA